MQLKTQHKKSSHAATKTLARVKSKKRAHPRRPLQQHNAHHQNGNNLHLPSFCAPTAFPTPRTFMSTPNNPPTNLPGGGDDDDEIKKLTKRAFDTDEVVQWNSAITNLASSLFDLWLWSPLPFYGWWCPKVYTPQTLADAAPHMTQGTKPITLIRRQSSPNKPAGDAAHKSIYSLLSAYPDVFIYMVVDLDDEANANWRGRYLEDILPVVLVSGEKFSEKSFGQEEHKKLEDVFRKAMGFDV